MRIRDPEWLRKPGRGLDNGRVRPRLPCRDHVQLTAATSAGSPHFSPGKDSVKTVNLHAKVDFEKGELGRVHGHSVVKAHAGETGDGIAKALQDVRAGSNGWFEVA
jgi:hypothetical protein